MLVFRTCNIHIQTTTVMQCVCCGEFWRFRETFFIIICCKENDLERTSFVFITIHTDLSLCNKVLLYIHISHIHVIYNYSNIWPIYILTPSRAPPKCCKRKIYLGSLLLEHYLWYSDVICCGLLPWQRCMYMSGIDWLGLMRGKCKCTFAQLLFPHLSFLARLS